MKKYNSKKLFNIDKISLILLISTFFSCTSDNPVTSQNEKILLPLNQANYWVFQSYELDPWNSIIPATKSIDSLYSSALVAPLNYWELLHFVDGNLIGSENYIYDNGKIRYKIDLRNYGINIDNPIWITIADLNKNIINNFDTVLNSDKYVFKTDTLIVKTNIAINTYKERADTGRVYNGKKAMYYGFDTKIDKMINFKYKFPNDPDSVQITVTQLQNLQYDFYENIGFFRIILKSSQINISAYPKFGTYHGEVINHGGRYSELINSKPF